MLHIIRGEGTLFSFAAVHLEKQCCCCAERFVCETGVSSSVQRDFNRFLYFEYTFISVRSAVFSYFEGMQDSSVFKKNSKAQIKSADLQALFYKFFD